MGKIVQILNYKAKSWWSDSRNKALVFMTVALLVSLGFNIYYNQTDKDVKIKEKTTIVTKIDTIRDTIPVVKDEYLVRYEYDTLKQLVTKYDTIYTNEGKFDKIVTSVDTIPANVEIPITQKVYEKDSSYKAWVSGYKQSLDSIHVYNKTVTINHEVTITKKDNKKFGIGPVIFGGYDIAGKKLGYGIGIGIQYNLIKF